MQIYAKFHFRDEPKVAATTGVSGDVTDFILPAVGDVVWHEDSSGMSFMGRVAERVYIYRLADMNDPNGSVQVTLLLDRMSSLAVNLGV